MSDMRSLIREVLKEELSQIRALAGQGGNAAPEIRREVVSLNSDADLNAFVHRILELGQDGRLRSDILSGRYQFGLGATGNYAAPPVPMHQPQAFGHTASHAQAQYATAQSFSTAAPARAEFTKGMVTERDINGLADNVSAIRVAKSVRFTPLARDEMRRRNIKIERTSS